jgi:hypothetical protein
VENNWIGLFDTAIQYYLHKDASALSNAEWCETIAQLGFLRTKERREKEKKGEWNYL